MAPLPRKLKPITAYIRRAEEFDRVGDGEQTKIIAYYCREYAAEQGVKLAEDCQDPEVAEFLGNLIGRLESDKEKLSEETDFTREDAARMCLNFANNVFTQADEEDRAGLADKETAKQFYVAGNILDVMQQFGELDEEVAKRKKYAKFKASDIVNMIKQGRRPTPGGPGEDLNTGMPVSINEDGRSAEMADEAPLAAAAPSSPILELGQNPHGCSTFPTAPHIESMMPPQEQQKATVVGSPQPTASTFHTTPQQPEEAPMYIPAAPVYQPPMVEGNSPIPSPNSAGKRPSKAQREDAIECCHFAIAALEHKDVDLAVQRLQSALDVLGRK